MNDANSAFGIFYNESFLSNLFIGFYTKYLKDNSLMVKHTAHNGNNIGSNPFYPNNEKQSLVI
jgi:hypothetical protein